MPTTQELSRTRTIHAITKRAKTLMPKLTIGFESLSMDLQLADCHIPLDLVTFLVAPDPDFAHDITGILRHLNRRTGKLQDYFVPRNALPEDAERPEGLPEKPSWFLQIPAETTSKTPSKVPT